MPAKCAVVAPMSTKSRQVIFGFQVAGAKIRAQGARERARKAVREGGLWWTCAAVTDDRAMPQWRRRLAPGQMPIGARRKPASCSIAFGGRRTHQSGNLKPR